MTRIGINPARGKTSDYRPAPVSVAVLTYLPSLEGYFADRLDVLKLVFASLEAHTGPHHDVVVFDNGSCQPVVDILLELKASGQINYLLLCRQNIGKIGALKVLFQAVPGEVIAYNDDDIFFYPGWLEASLEILQTFPTAGIVSGGPVRNASGYARTSLDQFAAKPPAGFSATRERRIPDSWEIDWALSTGRDPQQHLQATENWNDLILHLAKRSGEVTEAIGGANHFQFIGRKELLLSVLPAEWSGKLMGAMVELDETIDRLGRLRLSTANRYARHLGNCISPDLMEEIKGLNLNLELQSKKETSRQKTPFILRVPGSRRVLTMLYRRLFDLLYLKER